MHDDVFILVFILVDDDLIRLFFALVAEKDRVVDTFGQLVQFFVMPLAEAARGPVHHICTVVPGLSHQVSRVSQLARVASLVRAACRQAILKHDWRVARQLRRVGNQAVVASLRSVDHDAAERVILAQSLSRVRRASTRVIALTASKDLHRWLDLVALVRVLVVAL